MINNLKTYYELISSTLDRLTDHIANTLNSEKSQDIMDLIIALLRPFGLVTAILAVLLFAFIIVSLIIAYMI